MLKDGKLMDRKRGGKIAFQRRDENEACFVGKRNLKCFGEQNNLPSTKSEDRLIDRFFTNK